MIFDAQSFNRIKKDIFYGLGEYSKAFCELDIRQFLKPFEYKRDITTFLGEAKCGLACSSEMMLYIHLPFCFSRCVFCDTNAFKTNRFIQSLYAQSLIHEIELFTKTDLFENKKISCIYFGGGTPTCMNLEDLEKLMRKIKSFFDLMKNCDITCETHPLHLLGTEGRERINSLKEIGINRISLGVQTFNQGVLNYCNRYHTTFNIEEAVSNLKNAGVRHNLDMMIGLPGQTVREVAQDLLELEKLKPISIEYMRHSIVNERAINLYKNHPEFLTSDDDLFEMNLMVQQWMQKNNYEQSGYFSKNSQFFPYRYAWVTEVPYLAFGAKVRSHFGTITFCNHRDLASYFSAIGKDIIPIEKFHILNDSERILRSLYLRLQTKDGLSFAELRERFGMNFQLVINPILKRLKDYKLIIDSDKTIKLTDSCGRFFLEDICNFIERETIRIINSYRYDKSA